MIQRAARRLAGWLTSLSALVERISTGTSTASSSPAASVSSSYSLVAITVRSYSRDELRSPAHEAEGAVEVLVAQVVGGVAEDDRGREKHVRDDQDVPE